MTVLLEFVLVACVPWAYTAWAYTFSERILFLLVIPPLPCLVMKRGPLVPRASGWFYPCRTSLPPWRATGRPNGPTGSVGCHHFPSIFLTQGYCFDLKVEFHTKVRVEVKVRTFCIKRKVKQTEPWSEVVLVFACLLDWSRFRPSIQSDCVHLDSQAT